MTHAQFNKLYKSIYPNYKVFTLTDRRLYYNDLMESLYRGGAITEKQNSNWGHPAFLIANRNKINCNAY